MTERNRELLALVPAALLVTAGFAAVFVQRDDVLTNASLTYGGVFLGLCFVAHLIVRVTLPHADPYLFPLVATLACLGLVVLYRLDEDFAREQAQWFVVGLIVFAATIIALRRDVRVLERYRYVIAMPGTRGSSRSTARISASGSGRSPSSRRSCRRSRTSSSSPPTCATRARCWCRAATGSSGCGCRR